MMSSLDGWRRLSNTAVPDPKTQPAALVSASMETISADSLSLGKFKLKFIILILPHSKV